MNDPIREAFERVTAPSFGHELMFKRNQKNEYFHPMLEDHWQTFQEGWEAAIEFIKKRDSMYYTDIKSDGEVDPR